MIQTQTKNDCKLWIGIDFHKKTWRVHFRSDLFSGNPFSMEPNPKNLLKKVNKEFPNYEIHVVYECGCFGFWAHRAFESFGWNSVVVNPSDIPRRAKHKFQKTDTIDARNLSEQLKAGSLKSVSIPNIQREQFRGHFRRRNDLVKSSRMIKSRIKSMLLYYGIEIPEHMDNANWTKEFKKWLADLKWKYETGESMMKSRLRELDFNHKETLQVSNEIRKYCRTNHKRDYQLLQTVPGVGPLTAICFLVEVGEISRFKNFKQLASMVGLVPTIYQSADTIQMTGLTPRCLRLMRSYIVEAAWQAVRIDPVMQEYYRKHTGKKPNDIIIKVARKLLSRMYGVLRTKQSYEIGLVQ